MNHVGEVWEEKLSEDDPNPWIYLVLNVDDDEIRLMILCGAKRYEGGITTAGPQFFLANNHRRLI